MRPMPPVILTASGLVFDYQNPDVSQIRIEDIAHALSMTCRFAGHTKTFYSVAEHSVRVSWICSREDALWGLLHDASEAYVTDIPTPLKRLLPAFKDIENHVMATIADRFGLVGGIPESVRNADAVLLATEGRDLCNPAWMQFGIPHTPLRHLIEPFSQVEAKQLFLDRFKELTRGSAYV